MWNNDVFRMLQGQCCLFLSNRCILFSDYHNYNDDVDDEQYEEMKYDTDRERRSAKKTVGARSFSGYVGGQEHWGHIECHCSERKNQTVKEIEESKIIHSDRCKWTCCNRKWDQWMCYSRFG